MHTPTPAIAAETFGRPRPRERREALVAELRQRIVDRPRMPDGRLALQHTPCDAKVFEVIAVGFCNGTTGKCTPGYRAIAAKAEVSLGTVHNSTERLRRGGWIRWRRVLVYVHGQLRFGRRYEICDEPPALRSRSASKPKLMKEEAPQQPSRTETLRALGVAHVDPAQAQAELRELARRRTAERNAAWLNRRAGRMAEGRSGAWPGGS